MEIPRLEDLVVSFPIIEMGGRMLTAGPYRLSRRAWSARETEPHPVALRPAKTAAAHTGQVLTKLSGAYSLKSMREREPGRASRVTRPVRLRARMHSDAPGGPSSVFGQDFA